MSRVWFSADALLVADFSYLLYAVTCSAMRLGLSSTD